MLAIDCGEGIWLRATSSSHAIRDAASSPSPSSPEAILEWLHKEMGYRPLGTYAAGKSHLPSVDSIRWICRGNMIPVWNFLVTRAKFEKTVRNIRRNITVHGGDAKEEARGKGGARKKDRALAGEGSEATMREAALQELDFAAKEVERLRNAVRRQRKDLRARMLEVSRDEAERKRILDERANYRFRFLNLT
ncbi:hypothetical protein Fmac_016037 [Flemingia macrophylla]|uniref:Uncharacterized protein n=1 Tax=Flemingia macrophylla TaxID=520843 RepID=A0ABD1MG94_9FABA